MEEKGEFVEAINSRKKKIFKYFNDRYDLLFLIVLISAIAFRIYFFVLTKNQPLWWDEAEYALRAKAFAFGTPLTGWAPERELVIPFFFSLFFRLGLGEISLRVVQLTVSISTVFLTYLVVSNLSSKRIGLFASFGMSFFWLHLFFSQRVLLYLWVPFLYLIIIYLFTEGYIKNRKKYFIAFGIFSAIALMTYFSVGFLLFGIFLYLFLIEGKNIFKNKMLWKVFLVFLLTLSPFLIYFQITYGFPIPRLAIGYKATTTEYGAGLSGLFSYISMFPSRVGWTFSILGLFGLSYLITLISLGFGLKGNLTNNKNWLLLFFSFIIPFSLYTLYGVIGGSATFYDGFILGVFPFFFAFSGLGLDKLYTILSKNKLLAVIVILLLLSHHLYFGVISSNNTIKNKITSYDSVKEGGLWIKENSLPQDIIISQSVPQNTYYSERNTIPMPNNESELLMLISSSKPKYFVDSIWQPVPDWVHQVPQKYPSQFKPVIGYKLQGQEQVSLVIYEINYFS